MHIWRFKSYASKERTGHNIADAQPQSEAIGKKRF